MKVKLKPLKQILEEFGFDQISEEEYELQGDVNGEFKYWQIINEMFDFFGKEIELEEVDDIDYTHVSSDEAFYFHELWFQNDFLKEDDFKID